MGPLLVVVTTSVFLVSLCPSSSTSASTPPPPTLYGLSFQHTSEKKKVEYTHKTLSPKIPAGTHLQMSLYGEFPEDLTLAVVLKPKDCSSKKTTFRKATVHSSHKLATAHITLPSIKDSTHEKTAFICLGQKSGGAKVAQGVDNETVITSPWLTITLYRSTIPKWVYWIIILFLLCLSGLFSGLNLGLLSLSTLDLKILINTGTPSERSHAKSIKPIRRHGNLLLCSLVFSNVLVNSTLTLLMDMLTDGFTAIIVSTFAIVLVGEIIPQAVCSRFGLQVAGYTIWITKFFMVITFPLSFPLGKLLDRMLGEEIGVALTRERLKEIIKAVRNEHLLENEEVGIISGALDLKHKTVVQIMRRIDDVFLLPIEGTLDFKTMLNIQKQGFSRIPIYSEEPTNIVAILNVKQLILVDFKDEMPIRDLVDLEYFKRNLFCVFENTRLDFMFRKFREGNRGHMAFVDRVNDEGPGDPFYERIGIVTMEDVLEELLQQEIMDESDVGTYSSARVF